MCEDDEPTFEETDLGYHDLNTLKPTMQKALELSLEQVKIAKLYNRKTYDRKKTSAT